MYQDCTFLRCTDKKCKLFVYRMQSRVDLFFKPLETKHRSGVKHNEFYGAMCVTVTIKN